MQFSIKGKKAYKTVIQLETNSKNLFIHYFISFKQRAELNKFYLNNIYTLGNLSYYTKKQLLSKTAISPQTLNIITQLLNHYNLSYKLNKPSSRRINSTFNRME